MTFHQELPELPYPTSIRFKIDAAHVRKLARLTNLKKKPAPTGQVEVTPTQLRYITSTVDGRFTVAATVPLHEPDHDEGVQFSLNSTLFAKIGQLFEGILTFSFEPNDQTLRWRAERSMGQYAAVAGPAEAKVATEDSEAIATLPAATLCEAISQAALFGDRSDTSSAQFNGLRIGGGAARSGYSKALSRYASSAIPDALEAILPKRHASNVKTVLAKLSGPVEIFLSDTTVRVQSSETQISWAKEGSWPASLDRIFQLPTTSSFIVATSELQKSIMLLSIALDWIELRIEKMDDLGRLILAGHSKSARGRSPLSPWMRLDDLPTEHWTFALKIEDLLASVSAIRTDHTELLVTDRGLYIRSEASSYNTTAFLLGSQPN
jgi:hypothetical protein